MRGAYKAWQSAQPQWQPIELAPKDGRFLFLGWFNEFDKWRSVNGQWFSEEQISNEWEFYELEDVSAEDLQGWYEVSIECNTDISCWKINPTHFMLKPKAPEKISEK